MDSIYLDNAATTPVLPEVVDKMKEVLSASFGNPSSIHSQGRTAKSLIESTRKSIAKELGALPSEIIFTSGGTEGDNMILQGAVRGLGVETIITSKIEHHAVIHAVESLEQSDDINVHYVQVSSDGSPDLADLERLLQHDDSKKLVSLMHVNNELGTICDLEAIGNLCRQNDALFHSDTVQSIGHYQLNLQELPIDFAVAAAHKFHGPKGIGFVFIRKATGLQSLLFGGGQERGLRAGTESVHNIVGLGEAFSHAYSNLDTDKSQITDLKMYCINQLKSTFSDMSFNGCCDDLTKSTYTIVNARIPMSPEKANLLGFTLDLKGICCSKGSACQAGSEAGSHVLNHILSKKQLQSPSIRISFSKYNTKQDVDQLVDVLNNYISA
ncbi:MAG: cysteine desulfurase [Flavobacteriaceae bacterium TMED81]|nr:MAG: cysteine desulfurase [Flavobacteriaceae bacterium TMED81]